MNWREVIDDEQQHYAQIAAYLQGGGVPSMDDAIRELYLQPVHGPFKELVNAGMFNWLYTERAREAEATLKRAVGDEVEEKGRAPLQSDQRFERQCGRGSRSCPIGARRSRSRAAAARSARSAKRYGPGRAQISSRAEVCCKPISWPAEETAPRDKSRKAALVRSLPANDKAVWGTLFGWTMVHSLGKALDAEGYTEVSRDWIDEWFLGRIIAAALREFGSRRRRSGARGGSDQSADLSARLV